MPADPETKPALVFSLGDQRYGVRLESVREISVPGFIEPVPCSPDMISGLAEVRGRMTTVIALGPLVGAPRDTPPEGGESRLLILAEPRDHLALRATGDIHLMELEFEEIETSRPSGSVQDVFEATAFLAGTPVHLFSAEKILASCESEILKRFQKS